MTGRDGKGALHLCSSFLTPVTPGNLRGKYQTNPDSGTVCKQPTTPHPTHHGSQKQGGPRNCHGREQAARGDAVSRGRNGHNVKTSTSHSSKRLLSKEKALTQPKRFSFTCKRKVNQNYTQIHFSATEKARIRAWHRVLVVRLSRHTAAPYWRVRELAPAAMTRRPR